jgi:hypothetical protein
MKTSFKKQYTLEERSDKYRRLNAEHPNCILAIVENSKNSKLAALKNKIVILPKEDPINFLISSIKK